MKGIRPTACRQSSEISAGAVLSAGEDRHHLSFEAIDEAVFVWAVLGDRCVLGSVYGAQELHELVTDLGRGFVLYPVAYILDFEIPHETGKAGAEFFDGWIEHSQAIRLPRNEKGRLRDPRAFPSTGQIEIGLRGSVVIQATVKAGTLEFADVMSDVIWFHP